MSVSFKYAPVLYSITENYRVKYIFSNYFDFYSNSNSKFPVTLQKSRQLMGLLKL